MPTVTDLYPPGRQVTVSAGALGSVLEGASRPGHFDGVLTVVLKLLNIVGPDVAVFGQKDIQQLACIQRMVVDLNVPVEVLGAPIVRDADGLALSSRNVFLSAPERSLALSLSTALEKAATQTSVPAARMAAYETLDRAADDPAFALDYAALVNPTTFAELPDDYAGPAIFAMAARVGADPTDRQRQPDLRADHGSRGGRGPALRDLPGRVRRRSARLWSPRPGRPRTGPWPRRSASCAARPAAHGWSTSWPERNRSG